MRRSTTAPSSSPFAATRSRRKSRRGRPTGSSRVWCHGFTPEGDGYPRYIGTRGMNAIAKHIAVGLDVRCRCDGVRDPSRRWRIAIGGKSSSMTARLHRADAVISTCPLAADLLVAVRGRTSTCRGELVTDDYDRTIALLAVLDGRARCLHRAVSSWPDGIFSFVADNAAKGISAVPALTLHAEPGWSEEHWDDDRAAIHDDAGRRGATVASDRHVSSTAKSSGGGSRRRERRGPIRAGSRQKDRSSSPATRSPDRRSRVPSTRGWPRRPRSRPLTAS